MKTLHLAIMILEHCVLNYVQIVLLMEFVTQLVITSQTVETLEDEEIMDLLMQELHDQIALEDQIVVDEVQDLEDEDKEMLLH